MTDAIHTPLSDDALELVARRFAVLGEPARLRLLQALMEGERHVGALATLTGSTPANTSRHLASLADAGFLRRRKEGLQVFYSVADPSVFQLCELVCGRLRDDFTSRARAFAQPGTAG